MLTSRRELLASFLGLAVADLEGMVDVTLALIDVAAETAAIS